MYTFYQDGENYIVEKSTDSDFSGHLYGSQVQGIDAFGYYDSYILGDSSSDTYTNAFGFAGYLSTDDTIVIGGATTGMLGLNGYANSLYYTGDSYDLSSAKTKNFTFDIDEQQELQMV